MLEGSARKTRYLDLYVLIYTVVNRMPVTSWFVDVLTPFAKYCSQLWSLHPDSNAPAPSPPTLEHDSVVYKQLKGPWVDQFLPYLPQDKFSATKIGLQLWQLPLKHNNQERQDLLSAFRRFGYFNDRVSPESLDTTYRYSRDRGHSGKNSHEGWESTESKDTKAALVHALD